MIHIANSHLQAKISENGGELLSLFDIEKQTEILYQQEGDFWNYTAPILFPIIGACYEGQYKCGGTVYAIPNHGFARISPFSFVSQTPESAVFSLSQNEKTLAQYPFPFHLSVEYILEDKACFVRFHVKNTGEGDLPFQLGYHPAFRFDIGDLDKCYILFDKDEPRFPQLTNPRRLDLINLPQGEQATYSVDDPACDVYTLVTPEYEMSISMQGMNRVSIWRKTEDTPNVSIEPLVGGGDGRGGLTDIFERKGVTVLKKGQEFSITCRIQIA